MRDSRDEKKLEIRRSWKTYRAEGEVNGILSAGPKVTNLVTSKIWIRTLLCLFSFLFSVAAKCLWLSPQCLSNLDVNQNQLKSFWKVQSWFPGLTLGNSSLLTVAIALGVCTFDKLHRWFWCGGQLTCVWESLFRCIALCPNAVSYSF